MLASTHFNALTQRGFWVGIQSGLKGLQWHSIYHLKIFPIVLRIAIILLKDVEVKKLLHRGNVWAFAGCTCNNK